MLMWVTGKKVQDLAEATYLRLTEKDFFLFGVLTSNNMVWWKKIFKYKFKSECAETQNVQSQKTRIKKQSTAEPFISLGKGFQICPANFQKWWSLQKWKLNKSPYYHPYSDNLLLCNTSP